MNLAGDHPGLSASDANTLLCLTDRCCAAEGERRRAGKHMARTGHDGPGGQALRRRHRHLGLASSDRDAIPDVVMACCGRRRWRRSRRRPGSVCRVEDPSSTSHLMKLRPHDHPDGLPDAAVELFTAHRPVIFAPRLPGAHQPADARPAQRPNLHAYGFREEDDVDAVRHRRAQRIDRWSRAGGAGAGLQPRSSHGLFRQSQSCWSSTAATSRSRERTCRRSGVAVEADGTAGVREGVPRRRPRVTRPRRRATRPRPRPRGSSRRPSPTLRSAGDAQPLVTES